MRVKCPSCGYPMIVLRQDDNRVLCYCAGCKMDRAVRIKKSGEGFLMTDILIDVFNLIYTKQGFKGVLEEVENRLEYGTIKKINGLYRISTGGHSDDEHVLYCLTHMLCHFSKHYCGYIRGGAFYFCEETYADVEMVRVY